ncbi:unnamed protein product [Candidula unifasciata]|uniref:Paraoxonase n=1 Tax=Candidula unifasciata TaxID=100452 RepID=A0A8S3ZLT3_9EUPU|nr:unnamed protein product [Candidula unifasciata]
MIGGAVKVGIAAIIVYKIAEFLLRPGADADVHFKKHYPGECRQVKGIDFGSEDLEVTKDGLAFITSGLWFPGAPKGFTDMITNNNAKGSIFLYDFNKPDLGARKLKLIPSKHFDPEIFHPHGISLLEDEANGEHLLYVVSHRKGKDDAVEKFRYSPKTNELIHVNSFAGDELHITNDLAVISEDKFYITNMMYFKNPYLSIIENLLALHVGSLVFFNGTGFTTAITGMRGPNGVSLSRDRKNLYVNLPFTGSMKVFDIKADYSLTEIQSLLLYTGADNLHVSQSGDALYTGAHPVLSKIMEHISDPSQKAPSSVLKLPLNNGKVDTEKITELFYDHGELISGSSVAAVHNNQLLIGSVIHKLVICDANIKL